MSKIKPDLHLRGGSGSDADGSNDILVTALGETKVGDVVLVKGIVATDRNFGSRHSYNVPIEEVALQRQSANLRAVTTLDCCQRPPMA